MRFFRMVVLFLILLCLVPPLVLLMVSLLARWAGCDLDPDVQVTCNVLGGDYGDIFYAMAHFGWRAVWTLPILVTLLIGWAVIEILRTFGRTRKPAAPQTPADSRNRERGS
jgi:hypothetical protein